MTSALIERVPLPSDQDASGRTFGDEELAFLQEALESGTLTSTKGRFVRTFEEQFARLLGIKHGHALSSGSAAIHAAVAAINPEPGDEIITSPITDMGALAPIVYQSAIPVFADVDPLTGNVTKDTIAARLSERTKAIVVTHLFGQPCEMNAIVDLARRNNIAVIEDCAQAFLAQCLEQPVGTIGDIGCFSLQQGKHITTGEGGMVVTNNPDYARRMYLFLNKAWGYGDPKPDHYFLALNYRMSELQGAVALAQLPKLRNVVETRQQSAMRFSQMIADLPGITVPVTIPNTECTWWKYPLLVDPEVIRGGTSALGGALREFGVPSAPRYIQKPAFACEVFRDQRTFGNSKWPFTLARPEAVDYRPERFPGTYRYLDRVLVLPWNEKYSEVHLDHLAQSLQRCVLQLRMNS